MKGFEFDFEKFRRELNRELNQKALKRLSESNANDLKTKHTVSIEDYEKAARVLDRVLNRASNDGVVSLLDYEIGKMEKALKSHYAERERFNKYTDFDAVVEHEMQKNYYEGWLEALMDFKGLLDSNFNLEKERENEWKELRIDAEE